MLHRYRPAVPCLQVWLLIAPRSEGSLPSEGRKRDRRVLVTLTFLLAPAEQDHAARHSILAIACLLRASRHQVRLLRIVLPSGRSVKQGTPLLGIGYAW